MLLVFQCCVVEFSGCFYFDWVSDIVSFVRILSGWHDFFGLVGVGTFGLICFLGRRYLSVFMMTGRLGFFVWACICCSGWF